MEGGFSNLITPTDEPPSYEETFGDDFPIVDDEDNEDANGQNLFTPFYPVYNFQEKKRDLDL